MTNPNPQDYIHWKRNLAGEDVPIHDGHPQCGYYKIKKEGGGWRRVAIWLTDDLAPRATLDGKLVDASEIWLSAVKRPIEEEVYLKVDAGEDWPDEVPGIGHNTPDAADNWDELNEQIEDAASKVDEYKTISTQAEADQAANLRDILNSLHDKAEDLRVEEKRPHAEATAEIQQRWKPIIDVAKSAANSLRAPLGLFLSAQKKKAEKAAPSAEVKVSAGGAYKKKVSLRTQVSVEVKDHLKALEFVKDHDDIKAAVQKVCKKIAKAGVIKIPGVKVIETEVAV